jgi:hypothetical protein
MSSIYQRRGLLFIQADDDLDGFIGTVPQRQRSAPVGDSSALRNRSPRVRFRSTPRRQSPTAQQYGLTDRQIEEAYFNHKRKETAL